MHGSRGNVWVGSKPVTLETLVDWSKSVLPTVQDETAEAGRYVLDLEGKVLYLGSCASLNVSREQLKICASEPARSRSAVTTLTSTCTSLQALT